MRGINKRIESRLNTTPFFIPSPGSERIYEVRNTAIQIKFICILCFLFPEVV